MAPRNRARASASVFHDSSEDDVNHPPSARGFNPPPPPVLHDRHLDASTKRRRTEESTSTSGSTYQPPRGRPRAPDVAGEGESVDMLSMGDIDDDRDSGDESDDEIVAEVVGRKRKRVKRDPMLDFIDNTDIFVHEHLRLDGMRSYEHLPVCPLCEDAEGSYRCLECLGFSLYCKGCIATQHSSNPFHRLEQWSESEELFLRSSCREVGVRISLCHSGGSICPYRVSSRIPCTILHTNGVHEVFVDECGCGEENEEHHDSSFVQFLRMRLWPSTLLRPKTAFTLDVLELFTQLTEQSKINVYDFYHTLVRLTDNTTVNAVKTRYRELSRAVRQYRLMLLAKRGGRGHDPTGVKGTVEGSCAIECPACPHPFRNLPEGWEDAPDNVKFLYILVLSIDANFRLKRRLKGTSDIRLSSGWAYFVNHVKYTAFLATQGPQTEISYCDSQLHAIDHANKRGNSFLDATGVGGVSCARHMFNRALGFGDLQKGERYCNMDFVLLSTLAFEPHLFLLLTYDIACQWRINLRSRVETYPVYLHTILLVILLLFAIPKFHLPAHGAKCQDSPLNLNLLSGAARSFGEGIEQGWAAQNPISMSTREMTAGNREETLDAHWGAWNHRKKIGLGNSLDSQLKVALEAREYHCKVFDDMTASLHHLLTDKWKKMIDDWDKDSTQANPYEEPQRNISLADVQLKLAEEEAAEIAAGAPSRHQVSVSGFLSDALVLEEQQRNILVSISESKSTSTSNKSVDLHKRVNALHHRIQSWRKIQVVYLPNVPSEAQDDVSISRSDTKAALKASAAFRPLMIPSTVPASQRSALCPREVIDKEKALRLAQCEDALLNLQHQLRVKSAIINYRLKHVAGPGQKANTRAQGIIQRFQGKIDQHEATYNAARAALLTLVPEGDWKEHLLELKPDDIKGPLAEDDQYNDMKRKQKKKNNDEEETDDPRHKRRRGEGHRVTSWIWLRSRQRPSLTAQQQEMATEVDEGMRVEWCKAYARKMRWEEEVELLQEEMRRTLAFLRWRSTWWLSQIGKFNNLPPDQQIRPDIERGLQAYARKQARFEKETATRFATQWLVFLHYRSIKPSWADEHPTAARYAKSVIAKVDTLGQRRMTRIRPLVRSIMRRRGEASFDSDDSDDDSGSDDDMMNEIIDTQLDVDDM